MTHQRSAMAAASSDGHGSGQRGKKRAAKQHDFEAGSDEDGGMQKDHPAVLGIDLFADAATRQFALVTPRDTQLDEACEAHAGQQGQERDNAQVHCSSSISALKPGPKAASSPRSPELICPRSSHSLRTKSTEALERLP